MKRFFAALVVLVAIPCFRSQHYDSDANIYAAVVKSLQELKVRQLAERLGIQQGVIQAASSVCYDDLGCFDRNGTFKHVKQLPDTPENVATQFLLYTPKNIHDPQLIDYTKPETVLNSNLDPSLPLKFITHGFGGRNNLTWVWAMKHALLQKDKVNIIIIDWSIGARVPYYINAAVNAELVGAQAAALYYFIKDNLGIQEKDLHAIGFSLGGQVVGFIGKRMQMMRGTRPGRITGLDPASPLFEDYGGEVHLYKNDADFVDVIHTNADMLLYGGVGMGEAIGHVDYYPNGGKRQPGCATNIKGAFLDLVKKGERQRACNHERAVYLFIESILKPTPCQFTSYQCTNYSSFETGKCLTCYGESCGVMGYRAQGKGSYYFMTKGEVPFCADNVKLSIQFSKDTQKSHGAIVLTLLGEGDYQENITITESDDKLLPGDSRSIAVAVGLKMKPIKEIVAVYKKYNGWFTTGTDTFRLGHVTIKDSDGKSMFSYCLEEPLLKDNVPQRLLRTADTC